jgi:hypothetical protein
MSLEKFLGPSTQREKRMLKKIIPGVALLAAALLPVGCSQNDPDAPFPNGPSTGLIITKVSAIPDVVPADGSTLVTLRLETRLRTGDPLPGRSIVFYIFSGACGGVVTEEEDVTDANGVAWGVYQAGTIAGCYEGVRGKITDPRESAEEFQNQDDVYIEHY